MTILFDKNGNYLYIFDCEISSLRKYAKVKSKVHTYSRNKGRRIE